MLRCRRPYRRPRLAEIMYLGIDLTSAVKTVVVDRAQRVIASASRPLRTASPRPGLEVCRDQPLARILDRLSQHGVKLALAEFIRLLPVQWFRYLLFHRAGTGGRQRQPSLRDWSYSGLCCWRPVTTLQAQSTQPPANCVTATSECARDLCGAVSQCPEFFEQRYVSLIPSHGRYYNAGCRRPASLVFVWLAHDRRFVGGVLFFFLIVIFVFIRIARRHRVADHHERDSSQSTQEKKPRGHVVSCCSSSKNPNDRMRRPEHRLR